MNKRDVLSALAVLTGGLLSLSARGLVPGLALLAIGGYQLAYGRVSRLRER